MTVSKGSIKSILYFSFVFFLLLTPYMTGNNIEELMSDSINNDYSMTWNGYEWDGFKSLSILYFTLSMFCWFTPPIIAKIGAKAALGLGGAGCCLALATFLHPFKYGLMTAAFITGVSSSILWTAQGSYLGSISSKETDTRDTGLFYSIYMTAPILGGSMTTLLFSGKENIPKESRTLLYSALIGVGCVGVFCTIFLKSSVKSTEKAASPLSVIKKSFQLLTTKRIALLVITFANSGQLASFMANLYGTTVGYTRSFGVNRKQYAGESGMLIGGGELLAGLVLLLTRNYKKAERLLIVAYMIVLITCGCIYVNIPDTASKHDTSDQAIIHSNITLALICALLIGYVDGCYETQIYRTIVKHYPEDTTAPFALYFFAQTLIMGLMNLVSSSIGLHVHCILLACGCTLGIIAFFTSLRVKDGRGDTSDDAV